MAQIHGIQGMYYTPAALNGLSTGSIGTASELATPKKRNQILALESPILLITIHKSINITCINYLQYVR